MCCKHCIVGLHCTVDFQADQLDTGQHIVWVVVSRLKVCSWWIDSSENFCVEFLDKFHVILGFSQHFDQVFIGEVSNKVTGSSL